jgi:hypothetical protein
VGAKHLHHHLSHVQLAHHANTSPYTDKFTAIELFSVYLTHHSPEIDDSLAAIDLTHFRLFLNDSLKEYRIMTEINVRLSIQVPGGPSIQTARTVDVDAYETIEVALLPNDAKNATVAIDVLGVATKVKLLLIQSSLYSSKTGDITWSLGDTITDRKLGEPQLFLGSEAIDALGLNKPVKITFKNTYPAKEAPKEAGDPEKDLTKENTANLSILVGRVA